MKSIVLAAALTAVAGSAMADSQDLLNVLAAAHANYQQAKTDPFGDSPPTAHWGAPFRLEIAPAHIGTSGDVGATWDYKDGVLVLNAFLSGAPEPYGGNAPTLFTIRASMVPGEPYSGQNAFGAERQVSVEHWTDDAVAFVSAPRGDLYPGVNDVGLFAPPAWLLTNYWVAMPLSATDGRRLSEQARFVIEGEVAPLPDGNGVHCGESRSAPEFDHPRDITRETCWVGAKISRMAWVDSADGRVLREWVAKRR